MKVLLYKRRLLKAFIASAILLTSIAVFSGSRNTQTNQSAGINLTDFTMVTSANAECSTTFCSGAGSGCTITVEGTNFTSSVCKGK